MMLWRAVLLLSLLLMLPIVFIRAQHYDNTALRTALIPPEGCPAPCFLGIRPGVTSGSEALDILRDHDWVRWAWERRTLSTGAGSDVLLLWRWDSAAPDFIRGSEGDPVAVVTNGIVESIHFTSNVSFGDLTLAFGAPDEVHAGAWGRANGVGGTVYLSFDEPRMSARLLFFACPRLSQMREMGSILYFTAQYANRGPTQLNEYRSGPLLRDFFQCSGF